MAGEEKFWTAVGKEVSAQKGDDMSIGNLATSDDRGVVYGWGVRVVAFNLYSADPYSRFCRQV